jgi:hypothetical protein
MFGYISQILSQFTKTQRILALIILVFSIVVISIAPSYISAITLDRSELEERIKRQNTRIKVLESQIDTLDAKIRINRTDCTNKILEREHEFILMLDELRDDMVRYKSTARKMDIRQFSMISDTIVTSDRKILELPTDPEFNPSPMINKIEKMKSKIAENK